MAIRLSEQEIFEIAVDFSPAKLEAFLAEHCADRPEMRLRIERLLQVHRKSHLLDRPIASLMAEQSSLLEAFSQALQRGERPDIDSWLHRAAPAEQQTLLKALIAREIQFRLRAGEKPTFEEYQIRFPHLEFPESPKPSNDHATKSLKMDEGLEGTKEFYFAESALPTVVPDAHEEVGSVLAGKYKLVEAIGEGGMGSVYLAQQTAPVKRLVAIKIIKAGMDSKSILARFDAERQALAMMDHPNIAKVLDAGTTERLRPFFVMELVKGVPITKFCDDRQLDVRGRIALLISVCHAIQHAHQKGVIHRDIKPSNVLIATYDDVPVAKVIDFGLAKATGQQLTEATLVTGLGAVVGTPEYMSPEQASFNQLDIDTRTDVYSLGVLLFELLTGTTPVNRKTLKSAALLEILRIVREVDAPLASSRLSSSATMPAIAAKRGTEPRRLSQLIRGDLDWITSKALEKERSRRYESAAGLAQDLERFLTNEMVEARPPSNRYRLQKLFLRNKGLFIAASAILFALFIGVIGTSIGLYRAIAAEKQTEAEHEKTLKALGQANTEKGKAELAAKSEKEAAEKERKAAEREALASKQAQARELEAKAQAVRANTTAYAAQLSAIESHLRQGNLPAAFRVLDACAWEPRNWEYDWLASRVLKQGRLLTGHTKPVKTLAFSHDGKTLISGSLDCTVRVWDVVSGQDRVIYRGNIKEGWPASSTDIWPNHDHILMLGKNSNFASELSLWSLKSGEMTSLDRPLRDHYLGAPCFSSNGKRIAMVRGLRPTIVDAETGRAIDTALPEFQFGPIALNHDGSLIAACEVGAKNTIGVWTLPQGEEQVRVPKPSLGAGYSKLIFNSQRMQILCVQEKETVDILDATTGALVAQVQGSGSVQLSADGAFLVRQKDNRLVVYDTHTWKERFSLPDAKIFQFSPDSQEILTFHEEGFFGVRSYLLSNGRRVRSIPLDRGQFTSAAISPQFDWLAIANFDNEIWLMSLQEPDEVPRLARPSLHEHRPSGAKQLSAIDPTGSWLARIEPGNSSTAYKLRLWDIEKQQDREGPEFEVPLGLELECIAWTLDGQHLIAGGAEVVDYPLPTKDYGGKVSYRQSTVTMWDFASGNRISHCQQKFASPPIPPDSRKPYDLGLRDKLQFGAAFVVAEPGNQIAWTIGDFGRLAKWNLKTNECLEVYKKFTGIFGELKLVAFSGDGSSIGMLLKSIDSPSYNGEKKTIIGIWSLKTNQFVLEVPVTWSKSFATLAISNDGQQIALTDDHSSDNPTAGNVVHIWRVDAPATEIHCSGHNLAIVNLAFSGDGERLITSSKDGTTRIWSTRTGQELITLENLGLPFEAKSCHRGRVVVISGSALTSWQATQNLLPRTYFGHRSSSTPGVRSVAWNPKGDQIVSVSKLEVRSWHPESGEDSVVLPIESGLGQDAVFSADGAIVATNGAHLALRDPMTLQIQRESNLHYGTVTGLAFSPNKSEAIYSAGGQKHIVQWNVKDFFPRMVLGNGPVNLSDSNSLAARSSLKEAHAQDSIVIAVSPDGKHLASASDRFWTTRPKVPPQLKLWDLESGNEVACVATGDTEFLGWGGQVHCLAWSPDAKRLFAANRDGDIWVYDSTSLKTLCQWKGHFGPVFALAVEPQSQRLASGGEDGSIRLWNLRDGSCSRVLRGHRKAIRSLDFSPNGKELASASDDGTVKIWGTGQ